MLGAMFIQPTVLRWTEEEEKKAIQDGDGVRYVNKVVVPEYLYKGEKYPDSLGGGAYVLPFR